VAWRGDKEPSDPLELIDIVRGAKVSNDVIDVKGVT
jgi:hypothetical protein